MKVWNALDELVNKSEEVTNKMFINMLMEILGIIFLWLGLVFSILIHEMGHMIGHKLTKGIEDWIIQVGFGKKLISTNHYDIRIFPFSGLFNNLTPDNTYTKAQALMCSAGGPVFSLVLILILLALGAGTSAFIDYYRPAWDFIRTYNIIIFISAIIPLRYPSFFPIIGGMESDGMHILKALKSKVR